MPDLLLTLILGVAAGALSNLTANRLPPDPPETPSRLRSLLLVLAMVAAFAAGWQRFRAEPLTLAVFCLFVWFLLTVAVIDFEHRLVLNVMVGPAAVVALALSFLPGAPEPLYALLGGAAGFGLFLLISLLTRGTLGAGDVKLAGVIGLMTGFPAVFMALLWGIIFGGVGALALMALGRAGRKTYIAYAPYLCLGAIIALWRVL